MQDAHFTDYGPLIAALLREPRLAPLGPGQPNRQAEAALKALTIASLCAPHPVADEAMARCCLAGLWLYHDFVDEAHTMSQDIETPAGSYWHGLVHRREPDYSNAAYWFRRVGQHAIFSPLGQEAAELASANPGSPETAFLAAQAAWDPFAFIDLCQAVAGQGSAAELLCRNIQLREWQLLFDHCWRHAVGTPE